MTKIKFRAWYPLLNSMIFLEDFEHSKYGWFFNDVSLKRMQYSGLVDKNKREIYVGDIVNVNKYGGTPDYREVKYYTAAGYASLHPFQGDGYHWSAFQCEVVGNIYENPELLEAVL